MLTVPFPPRPTSPAYSPTSPACALRCRKPLFFAVCTCRRFESHVLFHTDSPTCVFPCPRALYDAMASPEASWRTAEPRHGRGLPLERAGTAHAAFRPLDPTLIAQCFFLIGRRPVACSAIVLRLALREGRPISRARLLFYPAIRVDSPTSPAVACSVRRQLSLHVERRAPRYESERTALVVAAPALVFETATSAPLRVATHHGHPSATYAFADATMRRRRVRCPPSDSVDGHDGAADARLGELSGAQRGHWGARTSLISSIPRSTLLRLVTCPLFLRLVFSSLPRRVRPIPRVHQRWLAASADNFPFMLVDVSRATRAREQLYTAIWSSRRRLSCSRPPERSLERTHIAHLFCPTQYSPTVGLRVLFLQKSSISSCLSLRSHRPIVPLVLVRLQRITKPSKIVTRLVFELFCSLFFST